MGKKGQAKKQQSFFSNNSHKSVDTNTQSVSKLPTQKLNEIDGATSKLLKCTGARSYENKGLSHLWHLQKEIDLHLDKVKKIESALKLPLPSRNEESFNKLQEWVADNGGVIGKVEIAKFEGFEYGLKALEDISEGETVLMIPNSLILSVDNIVDSPLRELFYTEPMMQELPNVALSIFLLVERFRTDRPSYWAPYLESLPSTYKTPMYYSLKELELLRPSPAYEMALKLRRNIARQYAHLWKVFQKNLDAASEILRNVFTYEQYRWAVSTVMARQNEMLSTRTEGTILALVPYWDFCNHNIEPNKSRTDPSKTYEVESGHIVSNALTDYKVGEQVFMFYGFRSNSEFMIYNGFVCPENDNDYIRVKFGIPHSDPLYSLRSEVLEDMRIPTSGEFPLSNDKDDPLDKSLLAFVRVFKMSKDQIEGWIAIKCTAKRGLLKGPLFGIDIPLDKEAVKYLLTRFTILLQAYPTSIEKDEEILKKENLTSMELMIKKLHLTEKRILQAAIEYCEKRIREPDISTSTNEEECMKAIQENILNCQLGDCGGDLKESDGEGSEVQFSDSIDEDEKDIDNEKEGTLDIGEKEAQKGIEDVSVG